MAAVRAVTTEPALSEPVDLVLAGALLASGPVREAVLSRLAAHPELRVRDAGSGAAGAAVLALADLGDSSLDAALHDAVLCAADEAIRAGHIAKQ